MTNKYIPRDLSDKLRLDADQTVILENQLEQSLSTVYEQDYVELQARSFVPRSTQTLNPYANSYKYRFYDGTGQVNMISAKSHDFPSVDLFAQEAEFKSAWLGNSYHWDEHELREAAYAGFGGLQADKGAQARLVMEEALDHSIAFGLVKTGVGTPLDPRAYHPGITGFLNNANVSTSTVATTGGGTTWAQKIVSTYEDVIADVAAMYNSILAATNYRPLGRPNRLLIPESSYQLLQQRIGSSNQDITVLQQLQNRFPRLRIESWDRLETASPAGGKLMVMYNDSPRNLFYSIPQEFQQEQLYRLGPLVWSVPCTANTAGTQIIFPQTMTYRTGF